jgi:hypothetical protein
MATALPAIEGEILPKTDATFVACRQVNGRINSLFGTSAEWKDALPADVLQHVKSLPNEELFPMGEKALRDVADDLVILAEIRDRFYHAKGKLMGYTGWKEFVAKNSAYSIRTIQRRLNEATGTKNETKVNDRYKAEVPAISEPEPEPDDIDTPEVKQVHNEGIANGDFWEDLYHKLNTIAPTISDGTEHVVATKLEESLTQPAKTQAEKNFQESVIALLEQIPKNFTEYAQKLKSRSVEPTELPTEELTFVTFSTDSSCIELSIHFEVGEISGGGMGEDGRVDLDMYHRIPLSATGYMPTYGKKTRTLFVPHFQAAAKVFQARLVRMNLWNAEMQERFSQALAPYIESSEPTSVSDDTDDILAEPLTAQERKIVKWLVNNNRKRERKAERHELKTVGVQTSLALPLVSEDVMTDLNAEVV